MQTLPIAAGARALAPALVVAVLGGCATFSSDGGFSTVESATRERGLKQDVRWLKNEREENEARAAVKKLIGSPLTADAAVQIALLNNRGLQATYAELGLAESDLVQAGRLVNPGFTFERLHRGGEVSIDRTFLINVLALITMPARTELERRRFQLAQTRVAAETLQVAADARRAWHSAVAARQSLQYMEQARTAAEASAELARRMAAAGNFSKLDRAREQLFYAEVTAQLARAQQTAVGERERLTRVMGLWGKEARYALPDRLPELPKAAREMTDLEAQAMRLRLDVQGAMKEAENVAAAMGLTRATGFLDVLEVGYRRNSETGLQRQIGYEVELRLPIFDWGSARIARAEYAYMQAVNRAAEIAVKARSEVREAYAVYRTAYGLARHYRDEIVPLRKRISEENLLRYNGMLIGVFELLADARQQVATVNAYIEALREHWIAETHLNLALTGKSPGAMTAAAGTQAARDDQAAGH